MLKICKKVSKKTGEPYVGLFITIGDKDYLLTCDKTILCELVGCVPSSLIRLEKDIGFKKM